MDIFGIPRSIFRKFWKKFWKKFWIFFFQVGCLFPLNWQWGIQIFQNFLKKITFSDFSTHFWLFLAFFTWKSQISTWSRAQNKKCHWKTLFRLTQRTRICKKILKKNLKILKKFLKILKKILNFFFFKWGVYSH